MATAILQGSKIIVKNSYEIKEEIKAIPGRSWNSVSKTWEIPLNVEAVKMLSVLDVKIDSKIFYAANELEQRLKDVQEIKENDGAEPLLPMPIKTKPYMHQVQGYNIGIKLAYAGLFMEQGCGKTLTTIAIIGRRFLDKQVKRVLIVAPASVLPVWLVELDNHADFPYEAILLEKSVKKREQTLREWQPDNSRVQIAIINYEAVWLLLYDKEKGKWDLKNSVFSTWIPDIIICDESQKIKGTTTFQSRGLHRLGEIAKYRLILTGTPVTQSPLDVFSQFKFLDKSIFGTSYLPFRNTYAVMGGFQNYQVLYYVNLEELKKKVHSISFRVTKAEALDLPDTVDQVMFCELESAAEAKYRMMKQESILEIEGGTITASNILTKLLRLSQITGGYMSNEDGKGVCISKAKLNLLSETIDDLVGAGKKIVVFARFIPEIAEIRKLCDKKKLKYAWIAGEVKDRGEQVQCFQKDTNCKIFIAQIQTAGLGITLTASDTAIFYSLSYSYGDYDQAKARIHRIGQESKCTYIHLIAKDTVDEKVFEVLKKKKSVADNIVDNWKNFF